MRCKLDQVTDPDEDGKFVCRCSVCYRKSLLSKIPCDRRRMDCNGQQPSEGLGDTVAKALSAVGIKKRKGCKCGQRQRRLNKMFPYRKKRRR